MCALISFPSFFQRRLLLVAYLGLVIQVSNCYVGKETAWSEPSIARSKPKSEPDLPPQRLVSCWARPHLWLGSWRLFILTGVWLTPRVDLFSDRLSSAPRFWVINIRQVCDWHNPTTGSHRQIQRREHWWGSPPEHAVFRSSLWEGKARVCFWFSVVSAKLLVTCGKFYSQQRRLNEFSWILV